MVDVNRHLNEENEALCRKAYILSREREKRKDLFGIPPFNFLLLTNFFSLSVP